MSYFSVLPLYVANDPFYDPYRANRYPNREPVVEQLQRKLIGRLRAITAFEHGKHNAHHFTKDGFKVTLNVEEFRPSEVTVKVVGRDVVIEGKQEEKEDEHGTISRRFVRRFSLPDDYDLNSVEATFSSDGHLIVKAPHPKKPPEEKARNVSIKLLEPSKTEKNVNGDPKDN